MQIENLTLYHSPGTRSARVKWLLHELVDDRFGVRQLSLNDAEQYHPDFVTINPNHAVPVLGITFHDGTSRMMIESGAMMTFLADVYADRLLAPPPTSLHSRADYLQMLYFGASSMDMMLWQIKIHEDALNESERDMRTPIRYRKKFIAEVEPLLRDRLEHHPFVCGADFLAVDCLIAHNIMWAGLYGLCRAAAFTDYIARLSQRPAFAKAFSDLHLFTKAPPPGSPVLEKFTG